MNGFLPFIEIGKEEFGLQCLYNYGPINNKKDFSDELTRIDKTLIYGTNTNTLNGLTFVPHPSLSPRDCVVIGETVGNVMLNLFQHLIKSIRCETLK